jgi:hypothetical protein
MSVRPCLVWFVVPLIGEGGTVTSRRVRTFCRRGDRSQRGYPGRLYGYVGQRWIDVRPLSLTHSCKV